MDSYRCMDFGLDGKMDRFGGTSNRSARLFEARSIHLDRLLSDSPTRYDPTFESTHGNSFLRPRTHLRPITFLWTHIGARVPRYTTGTRVSHLTSFPSRLVFLNYLRLWDLELFLPFFGFLLGARAPHLSAFYCLGPVFPT
jgi:hypothetical protein